jgi:hypothetical protein
MSDTGISWDAGNASAEPASAEPQYDPAPESAPAPAAPAAAPKLTPAEELARDFPPGTQIKFLRTEYAGQYGEVVGTKTVGLGQTYLQVRTTHYKNGTQRPVDRQKLVLTLRTSIVSEEVPTQAAAEAPVAE